MEKGFAKASRKKTRRLPIDSVIGDTLLLPFRDIGLLQIAIMNAVVVSVIAFAIVHYTLIKTVAALHSLSGILGIVALLSVLVIFELLVELFFNAAIVLRTYYGTKITVGQAFGRALGIYLNVVATAIVIVIMFAAPLAVIFILGAISTLFLILLIPYAIGAIYMLLLITLAIPFTVIGRNGPVESVRKSFENVKGNWWGVFACLLVVSIVFYVFQFVTQSPFLIQQLSSLNYTNQNVSAASQANVTANLLNRDVSMYSSPLFLVGLMILTVIYSWFIIMPVLIYKQLIPSSAAK